MKSGFWRGALETVGLLGAFVGFGLGWAELARPPAGELDPWPSRYPAHMAVEEAVEDATSPRTSPRVWLVDGFNVLNAALLGGRDRSQWWTGERRAELVELAGALGREEAREPPEVWVVFDGPRERGGAGEGPVREVFAPSADEWLVARLRSIADPSRVAVVTADRKVADRSRHRGAQVVSPREFVERCRGGESATS